MIVNQKTYQQLLSSIQEGVLVLIAGPPQIDNKALASETAKQLAVLCSSLDINLIYKASFKRVDSSIADEYSGIPAEAALKHLKQIGKEFKIPVQTDVYNELDVFVASKYTDLLQIPAYLFRDTSLLESAAKTGRIVNIRKGMTIRGAEMADAVQKIRRRGSGSIILTERGSMHGYDDVIVDIRNIMTMKRNNVPVFADLSNTVPDAGNTLSEQEALQTATVLGRAAIAAGASGIILDVHTNPAMTKKPEGYCFQVSSIASMLSELSDLRKRLTKSDNR